MRLRKLLALALTLVSVFVFTQSASADAIRDREYWIKDYGFNKAWQITKGEGVKVAIIDTGIDDSHPDLQNAISTGYDVSGVGNSEIGRAHV